MLRVNRKIEYALMTLKELGQCGFSEQVTAREISEKLQIPFDSVSKILQQMNNSGWVSSYLGIGGGYQLKKRLEDISMKDIYFLIEKKNSSFACLENGKGCEISGSCNILTPVKKLEIKVNSFLENLKISEILGLEKEYFTNKNIEAEQEMRK